MLIKQIDPLTPSSYPFDLTNVGGTLFFSADDLITGRELWKSDGTEPGTTQVKDTHSGYGSSDPSYLTNVGCTLFFSATDGTNGQELWKSDGTDAGTVLVRDINTSGGLFIGSYPSSLTNMGCTLFFQANDGSSGKELWKSDGTAASTVLVRDIYTGPSSSNPSYLTTVGGTLFFTASDASTGVELWKSDGTAAGTTLVKDIRTGTSGSNPGYLTNVGGTLFFIADDGYFGRELWKSDGTAAGTVLVRDINFGGPGSYPGELTNVGGTLYFIANDGSTGKELWKSDGTAAGTVLVKDISQGTSGSSPSNLTNVLGMVFLSAWDSINGAELWKSDGTEAGTVLVKDIRTGSLSSGPSLLTNVAGTLFFRAYDPSTGYELWRSDGTAVGTVIAADIAEFGGGSRPSELTEVGGALFFSAENDFVGVELYAVASTVSPSNADFGDAPDGAIGTGAGNYNTLATDGGPSHVVVAGLFLGNTVDVDNGMLQNEAANADDVFGELQNDEDGVLSPATDLIGTIGTTPTVTLLVTNTTGFVATLAGWIDFDNDGQFEDATERATLLIGTTTDERATLIFPSIPSGFTGTTYARFRLTTDTALFSTGAASDGEVEDYTFTITAPSGSTVDIMDKVASGIGGGPVLPDFGRFGSSLATLGDLDGDGLAELVVGASGDDTGGVGRGAVHTLGLTASGTVTSSAKIASGIGGGPVLADWDYFGSSVASLGDLNGDGISDLAVGATGDDTGGSNRGAVHVLIMNCFGTAKSSTKIGSGIGGGPVLANENYFGASLASLGDLDGDGVFDLVVGAIGDDTGGTDRGAAHVLLLNADGSVKSSKKIAHLTNGGPALADSDLFGSSLSSPGDLDGDGVSDLFVGATGDDTGGTDRGAVHVLLMNADGSVKSSTKIAHLTSGGPELSDHDHFGSSVAPLSDLDGDGVVDLIVGATGDATGGTDRGAAHVLLLNANRSVKNSTKIAHLTGGGPELSDENRFGSSVVPAGDLDGDGVFELAIGARGDNTGGAERGSVHFLSPHTFYDFLLAGFGIAEGNTTYTTDVVILTRSDSSVAETVDVVLTGVTAIAGSDFADGPISVSFAIGETIRLVPIEILGDSVLELDEMLSLSLANFTGTGRVGSTNPTSTLTIYDDDIPNPSSQVVARYVYYANSTFAQAGVSSALDTSKVLAQEGTQAQLLTYSNLINSGSGVDGLVFDIAGLPASTLTASDFVFQVSPQSAFDELANPPVSWNPALVPSAINVFPGTPSRVVIRWPQNSIVNRWLRVTIKANAHTGLAVPETYYVGHLLGETTGHSGSTFTVSFSDITPIRSAVGSSANASSTVDIDKNGTVAFADIVAMRPNVGAQLTIITIPAFGGGGSLAPMSGGLDNGGSNKSRSGNRSDQNQLATPLVNSSRNSQLPSTSVLTDRLAQLSSLSSPIQMLGGHQVMNVRRSVNATFLKDRLFGEIESSSTTRTENNAHTETEGLTTDFDRSELGQQKAGLIALDAFFAKY
jgi:ELWxxDGT repeat protein